MKSTHTFALQRAEQRAANTINFDSAFNKEPKLFLFSLSFIISYPFRRTESMMLGCLSAAAFYASSEHTRAKHLHFLFFLVHFLLLLFSRSGRSEALRVQRMNHDAKSKKRHRLKKPLNQWQSQQKWAGSSGSSAHTQRHCDMNEGAHNRRQKWYNNKRLLFPWQLHGTNDGHNCHRRVKNWLKHWVSSLNRCVGRSSIEYHFFAKHLHKKNAMEMKELKSRHELVIQKFSISHFFHATHRSPSMLQYNTFIFFFSLTWANKDDGIRWVRTSDAVKS